MERLTYDFCFNGSHSNQVKGADNLICSEVCEREESCNECPIARAFDRLAAIEDILGDDYNLDHLRDLIQADREASAPCRHQLAPLYYCCDDDYDIFRTSVRNNQREYMGLKYCVKCGAVFVDVGNRKE